MTAHGVIVKETWTWRDLPVLEAVVEAFEASAVPPRPHVPAIAEATGLSVDDVVRALDALDGEYLTFRKSMSGGNPAPWYVAQVFPAARRAVGQWPSPDIIAVRLADAMEQVAKRTTNEETKGRLRRGAEALGGLTKDVMVEVMAKMAEHQIGLS